METREENKEFDFKKEGAALQELADYRRDFKAMDDFMNGLSVDSPGELEARYDDAIRMLSEHHGDLSVRVNRLALDPATVPSDYVELLDEEIRGSHERSN